MKTSALTALAERVEGELRFDEPLAPYTTYRIGGPAAALLQPASVDDVVAALRFAEETETRWLAIGLGSNLLVSDAGFDGLVLRLGRGMDHLVRGVDGERQVWEVGAGRPTPLLARQTAKAGLAGVHRLIGVPGTVGGGVAMNAGAHGQDFGQVVKRVEIVDHRGEVSVRAGREIAWRYRSSGLVRQVVLSATLQLTEGDPAVLRRDISQHFRWRKEGTPFNEPCCGSVFRNPERPAGDASGYRSAGQLIDACGLKGFAIGGARVSEKHANYIVNAGGATAQNVLDVIAAVRERVRGETGVALELEVQVIE